MKKIAIVTRKMIAGGIEKALISMLEVLPKEEYDITLFLMGQGGEFFDYLPKWIKVKYIYGEEKSILEKIIKCIKKGSYINVFKIIKYSYLARKAKPGYEEENYLAKLLQKNYEEEYDVAIAYHVPASFPVIYVTEYLKAKKKLAWIHSDVEVYKKELNNYIDYYYKFDRIFCVSEFALQKFDLQYPKLSKKTKVFYNIINKEQLYKMSNEKKVFKDEFDGVRILTVGRLTEEKGYNIIPRIMDKLIKNNIDVKWYCIGNGELKRKLENDIKKYGLENKLILLGTKINPYPYFKECDIYIQPSIHEGYCITLAEAKLFNKPIISTDFIGALEQIDNGNDGIIVSFDEVKIYKEIIRLIGDNDLRSYLSNNLKNKNIKVRKNVDILLNI